MPESKSNATSREMNELHQRIAKASGFRPKDLLPGEKPAEVARLMRSLEKRGMVVFVDGVGWVDSSSAIKRYLSRKIEESQNTG